MSKSANTTLSFGELTLRTGPPLWGHGEGSSNTGGFGKSDFTPLKLLRGELLAMLGGGSNRCEVVFMQTFERIVMLIMKRDAKGFHHFK